MRIGATDKRQPGEVNRLNFLITTHCNLRCPECCAAVGERVNSHVNWEYVEHAAGFMRGKVPWLVITGGEPLTHPMIDEWSPKFKDLFGCEKLTIETNGFLAPKHVGALSCYDAIRVTRYSAETYAQSSAPYSVDNREEYEWIEKTFPEKFIGVSNTHIQRTLRPGPCLCDDHLHWQALAYCEGVLYPCCAMTAIPGAKGIPLQDGWESLIDQEPLPCERCWYGKPIPQ